MLGTSVEGGLTRRRLMKVGLAGAAGAGLGGLAFDGVSAAAVQPHPELLRSTYEALTTPAFTALTADGPRELALVGTEDLPIAAEVVALQNSDNAFAVRWRGGTLPPSNGLQAFRHPDIGDFTLFVSPVGRPLADGSQDYLAVVDSTVKRVPVDPSGAPAPVDPGPRADPPAPAAITRSRSPQPATVTRARLSRSAHRRSVLADVTFGAVPRVRAVRAVLRRHGRVVGRATGIVVGGEVRLRFTGRHLQARAGRYELTVVAVDSASRITKLIVPLRLR